MEFAKRLKTIREHANLSQKDVADKVGLSAQAYNNYEKRGYSPTPELLVKLAIALNTTPNALLGFKVKPVSDIEYASNYLDCIVVRKNDVLYEMIVTRNGPVKQIKIPKKDFIEIISEARYKTERIIEVQNAATRPALIKEFCDTEVFMKHVLD